MQACHATLGRLLLPQRPVRLPVWTLDSAQLLSLTPSTSPCVYSELPPLTPAGDSDHTRLCSSGSTLQPSETEASLPCECTLSCHFRPAGNTSLHLPGTSITLIRKLSCPQKTATKTTMRYQLTAFRMAIIKTSTNKR